MGMVGKGGGRMGCEKGRRGASRLLQPTHVIAPVPPPSLAARQVRAHPLAQHSERLKDMLLDALLHQQRRDQAQHLVFYTFPAHGAGLGGWGAAAADAIAGPPAGAAGGGGGDAAGGGGPQVAELVERLGSGAMC